MSQVPFSGNPLIVKVLFSFMYIHVYLYIFVSLYIIYVEAGKQETWVCEILKKVQFGTEAIFPGQLVSGVLVQVKLAPGESQVGL